MNSEKPKIKSLFEDLCKNAALLFSWTFLLALFTISQTQRAGNYDVTTSQISWCQHKPLRHFPLARGGNHISRSCIHCFSTTAKKKKHTQKLFKQQVNFVRVLEYSFGLSTEKKNLCPVLIKQFWVVLLAALRRPHPEQSRSLSRWVGRNRAVKRDATKFQWQKEVCSTWDSFSMSLRSKSSTDLEYWILFSCLHVLDAGGKISGVTGKNVQLSCVLSHSCWLNSPDRFMFCACFDSRFTWWDSELRALNEDCGSPVVNEGRGLLLDMSVCCGVTWEPLIGLFTNFVRPVFLRYFLNHLVFHNKTSSHYLSH